jgi:SRSO17 transposase
MKEAVPALNIVVSFCYVLTAAMTLFVFKQTLHPKAKFTKQHPNT